MSGPQNHAIRELGPGFQGSALNNKLLNFLSRNFWIFTL